MTIPPSIVQISLTFGFIYGTLVWALGHISGGHINPATSFAAGITRKISIVRCILYIVAQLLGGMVGAGILFGLTPKISQGSLGVNALNGVSDAQGFGMEVMITFVLVFTILSSIDTKRSDLNGSAPLTIGLAVAVGHLVAVSYTFPKYLPFQKTLDPPIIRTCSSARNICIILDCFLVVCSLLAIYKELHV